MSQWSLEKLLSGLHEDIHHALSAARERYAHPVAKGDASETVWLKLLQTYLPMRYQAERAFVVDSNGNFSEQIDVVIFDRQYSPFILRHEGQTILPAESVYGIFEAKQSINAVQVGYAQTKIASVRNLQRTSLAIPHAGGTYPPKPAISILGGILTFDSDWNPGLGKPLLSALEKDAGPGQLNLGCIAAHGHFKRDLGTDTYQLAHGGKPATAFLFNLISELQLKGTVPMIDVQAYARWLT